LSPPAHEREDWIRSGISVEADAEQGVGGDHRSQHRRPVADQLRRETGVNADVVQAVEDAVRRVPQEERDDRQDEALAEPVLAKASIFA
jgi:hypothetical protein